MRLRDKVAVVTGAADGIGMAIARAYACLLYTSDAQLS